MKRMSALLAAMLLVLAMTAGPAAAHHLVVDPPGDGGGHDAGPFEPGGWVGGGPLPDSAQGDALVPSPGGMLPPSHMTGLNTACEALRGHGNGAVDLFGPPPAPGSECPHGE